MAEKRLTLREAVIASAITAMLSTIVIPVIANSSTRAYDTNKPNLRAVALGSSAYGQDFDDRIPIMINGYFRDLQNVHDGELTTFGEPRADGWPLYVLPYLANRSTYLDPTRPDEFNVWSGPPLTPDDEGFVATANTYRNQSRFPCYGVNTVFLSPLIILPDAPARSIDFMTGESHGFFEAVKPSSTIFYLPSTRGYIPQFGGDPIGALDPNRGFFGVNAPGMMPLGANNFPYVLFVQNTVCSGDWCGADVDPDTAGVQTRQNFAFYGTGDTGNNVAMLDGHISFKTIAKLTEGTDYATAVPGGPGNNGGALIIDKTKYTWNLNDNYFGIY